MCKNVRLYQTITVRWMLHIFCDIYALSSDQNPGQGIILPSYIGIIISQYKDPYTPTSIMECHTRWAPTSYTWSFLPPINGLKKNWVCLGWFHPRYRSYCTQVICGFWAHLVLHCSRGPRFQPPRGPGGETLLEIAVRHPLRFAVHEKNELLIPLEFAEILEFSNLELLFN